MCKDSLIMSADFFAIKEAMLAWRKSGSREDTLDDFIQAARMGLVEAAQTYDAEQGAFTTWAHYRIRKQLQDLHKTNMPAYVPSRAYTDMTKEERSKCYTCGVYLSAPVKSTDGETTIEHLLEDTVSTQLREREEKRQALRTVVFKAICHTTNLSERDLDVITSIYGLNGKPPKSHVEVAVRYGLTRQRMGQIVSAAHDKLKRSLIRVVGSEHNLLAFL